MRSRSPSAVAGQFRGELIPLVPGSMLLDFCLGLGVLQVPQSCISAVALATGPAALHLKSLLGA